MKVDIGSELKKFFKDKGLTQEQIANQLGVKQSYINALFNNKQHFGKEQAYKWSELFGISSSWLLTGEGEMLKDVEEPISTSEDNTIPLIPMSARAGYLNDFMLSVRERDCERVISPIADADLAIQVAGDSMEPEYLNGSIIVTKRIDTDLFIEWGKAYLLDTPNGAIVKILKPSERDGFIRCESINPKYDAFDIPLDGVRGVYRVLISISVK